MKRIGSSIVICLALLLALLSCGKGKATVTAVGTTKAVTPPASVGSMIIRPPTRSANSQYDAQSCSLSLVELWESADAVAWVSVGNWLSETDHGSYYDASVIECYKGELPTSIVLEQAGSSAKTYTDFPLFTYGNEFLVFLQGWDAEAISVIGSVEGTVVPSKPYIDEVVPDESVEQIVEVSDYEDGDFFIEVPVIVPGTGTTAVEEEVLPEPEPPYEHCYQLLSGMALMDTAVGMDGQVYLLDRYYLVDPYLGFHAYNRPTADVDADVRQLLEARDAYCYRLFGGRILFRLTDLIEYLQNPLPETAEE